MKNIFLIANIIVSIIIVAMILFQRGGAGLGSAWGGGGETFQTRRGIEKVSMRLTVVFIVIFLSLSIGIFFIK